MKVSIIRCEGLPCPQPVLQCKAALDKEPGIPLEIYVDNEAARENVIRFLGSRGYNIVHQEQENAVFKLEAQPLRNGGSSPKQAKDDGVGPANMTCPVSVGRESGNKAGIPVCPHEGNGKTLVLLTSSGVGPGDDVLGEKLMQNFIQTLPELGETLWRVILLNGGVKLAVQGSPVLEALQALEEKGVSILVCGTCLEFFHLLEHKQVGQTTNMLDVVTSMQLADKVLNF